MDIGRPLTPLRGAGVLEALFLLLAAIKIP